MLNFAKALCRLQGERYDNSYIGKLVYRRTAAETEGERLELDPGKPGRRFQRVKVRAFGKDGRETAVLETVLFFSDTMVNHDEETGSPLAREGVPPPGAIPWHAFSEEEIREFSAAVGDTNPIHLTERPVVQGYLLADRIFRRLGRPGNITIRFSNPAYAGEMIYLLEEDQHEQPGYGNHKKEQHGIHPYTDENGAVCSAFSRFGLHLFSASVHPGHGHGADHRGEPDGVHPAPQ